MPLSIQHQADSAGDKAVSLIADNSGSNVAAAFKGVNKATQNGDTVADLVVSLDGEAIATGATDDAAAAGAIFPLAGLYQAIGSVDEVDTGDVGRVRMSVRRAMIEAPDYHAWSASSGGVAASHAGILVTTHATYWSLANYVTPTVDFFDGSDAGFATETRTIYIPMLAYGFRRLTINLYQNLGVNCTWTLKPWVSGAGITGAFANQVWSEVLGTTVARLLSGGAGGTGASGVDAILALNQPVTAWLLRVVPASDPSSGSVHVTIDRSS